MDIRDFQQLGKDKERILTTFIYTDANARNEVVEYLVRAEYPFTFVEKHDFTGWCNVVLLHNIKDFLHPPQKEIL